jgi:5-methylcytosine-specific restriction endonuclease McrA
MGYSEQYRHPNWQKKRLEVLERDNWTCQECGSSEKQLHVHHYSYVKGEEVYNIPHQLLDTLCYECHNKRHELVAHLKDEIFPLMSNKELEALSKLLANNKIE